MIVIITITSMVHLVVVESPNKVKKVSEYLGSDYRVIASVGHFRDLDAKSMSIDIANGFEPIYVVTKPDVVARMKKAMVGCQSVYLATDMDREGESISQHVLDVLKPKMYHRLVFNAITKSAVQQALKNRTVLNVNLALSQKARRVIDRLYGYMISPVLQKQFGSNLSAGRVQSVTVRLLVDRENKISEQIKNDTITSYQVKANVSGLSCSLYKDGKIKRLENERSAILFCKVCLLSRLTVRSVKDSERKQDPPPPYDTASLQQDGINKLKISAKEVMRRAQQLYEQGVITYIRTDSVQLSGDADDMIESYLEESHEGYYQKREFVNKNSQEAHEAIRPTDIELLDHEGCKLYRMIWQRTVASQMIAAKISSRVIQIDISKYSHIQKPRYFQTQSEAIIDPGYLVIYGVKSEELEERLIEGKLLKLEKVIVTESLPVLPQRYTEASLISKLKKLDIGRPSTYASIMSTIVERGYVKLGDVEGVLKTMKVFTASERRVVETRKEIHVGSDKRKLLSTPLGITVTAYLLEGFTELLDYSLTAKMEKKLDGVAEGKKVWNKVVGEYYDTILEMMPVEKGSRSLGKGIVARESKYGPVIQKRDQYCKIVLPLTIETITLKQAEELFVEKDRHTYQWKLGRGNVEARLINGRYGYYLAVTKGKKKSSVSLPKGFDVNKLDLAMVKGLIKN